MRKALLLGVILALFVISTVQAVTVSVTCDPEVISSPGGTTTIKVACSEAASGSINVTTPSRKSSAVDITVPAGGSVSKVYPTDFPSPASTAEVGEYEVEVSLSGQKFKVYFWVSFTVIPQTPLGVIGAIIACFSALGVKLKTKKK